MLDEEHADTLMELLPPVGWADVATKRDLDLKIDALEARLTAELHSALRQQIWAILGALMVAILISQVVSRVG